MKRRILSLLLSVCMVLGMVPVTAFAAEAEPETVTHPAAFAQAVTVDGAAAETDYAFSGRLSGGTRFGFLWTGDNLYLALKTIADEALTVSVNGVSVDTSGMVTATVKELGISLDSVGVVVDSYQTTVPVSIVFGDETWEGNIKFDPNTRIGIESTTLSGSGGGDKVNFGATTDNGVYHMWNKYQEGAANANFGSYYILDYQMTSLEAGKNKVLEFDFVADSLPVVTPGYLPQTAGYAGHGMNLVFVNSEKKGYTVAIVNTAEGLAFCVGGNETLAGSDYRYALLNKNLKDNFHMRLEYDANGDLTVYADDVLVGVFEQPYLREKSWGAFAGAIWVYAFNGTSASKGYCGVQLTEDGSNDMDYTLSNLRIGTIETPNPLDSLTFDSFKGSNTAADSVESDLVLPTKISNDILTDAQIQWTSSHPTVISSDGKVKQAAQDTEVTLTASLVKDPGLTKTFTVTVPAATLTHPAAFGTAAVDGAANETAWAMSGKLSGGTPFGFIWDKNNLYLAVKSVEDAQLSVTVNGIAADASGAVTDSVTELAISLAAVNVTVDSYDVTAAAAITYGEETWEGKIAFDPNIRAVMQSTQAAGIQYGTSDNLGYTFSNGAYRLWNKYNAEATQSGSNSSYGRQYILEYNMPTQLEAGKNKVIEFDFCAENLPVVTPRYLAYSAGYAGHGMNLSVINSEKKGFTIAVVNTEEGLAFCVNGSEANSGTDFRWALLNKQEKETFHLRLEYDASGDLTVYVDDVLLGVFEDTPLREKSWGAFAGAIWIDAFNGTNSGSAYYGVPLLEDGSNDMDFTVANVRIGTLETPDPLDSLTFEMIKGNNASADAIEEDLALPSAFSTDMLSGVKIRWTSSNPEVITNDGVVIAPDEATTVVLTAALVSNPEATKSFTVTVEAATVRHPAAFATPTVDGTVTEAAWALSGKLSDGTPFGLLWDKQNLYLAVKSEAAAQLVVSVNGMTVDLSGAVTGDCLEVAIPLTAINVVPNRYGISVNASLAIGEAVWEGKVVLDPNLRGEIQSTHISGIGGGDAGNYGATTDNGVYHMWGKYKDGAANANFGSYYILDYQMASLEAGKTKVVEFDFMADSLPVVTPCYLAQTAGYAGHGMNLVFVNSEKKGYTVAIVNTAEGLAFCVNGTDTLGGTDFRYALLGKNVGETFHIRLEYDTNGDLTVYADDLLVGVFEAPYLREKSWGAFAGAIWVYAFNGANANKGYCGVQLTADGANDMDFTLSNIRVGTVDTPNPLDGLTFDDIKGSNASADAIINNLVLPTEISTDMLTGIKIRWTSSNPAVISDTGVVTAPEAATEVVLTAALVSDPSVTKRITVTVEEAAIVHPAAFAEGIAADGILTETGWALSGRLSGKTPFGFAWDKENLYLAIASADDAAMTLTVNGYEVDVSGKVTDTVTELVIPLRSIGVTVNSYALRVKAGITFGEETWSGKIAFDPNARNMVPDLSAVNGIAYGTAENLGFACENGSYRMWNKYNSKATDAAANKTGGYVYGYQVNSALRGISKTRVIDFDFRADSLPVITPNTSITVAHAGGYGMSMTLVNGGTEYENSGFTAGIARTADGLVFHGFDSSWNLFQVPLGKEVGETFHVRLEYDVSGDLTVYVDDVYLTTLNNALLRPSDWGASNGGSLWLTLYAGNDTKGVTLTADGENDIDFTVSNVRVGTKEAGSLMDCLSFENIKGANASADVVRTNLNLLQELPHNMLSGVGISWTSSNESLISSATGKVTNPAVATQVTLTASLNNNPSVTKEFVVTVLPFAVEALLHEGDVTVDGKADEASWLSWYEMSDGSLVSAIWNKGMVYFAVETEADTLELTINGHGLLVDVANGTASGVEGATVATDGNMVEISVPHSAVGVLLTDFNQTTSVSLTATTGDSTATLPNGAELIFSGRTKDTTYTTIAGMLSQRSILGFADLMHVRENLTLPAEVETAFFEPFALEWVTSDPDVITAAGVINRHATEYGHAVLTLKFGGKELWSVNVTVDPQTAKQQPSSSVVRIGFAGDGVVLDGSIVGEDWVMATRLMNSAADAVMGEMAALWDEENLYLAIYGTGALDLEINGVAITAENASIAAMDAYREIRIPLSVIGVENADYGDSIEVVVSVGDGSWSGKLILTPTDWWMVGNRVESIPVPASYVASSEYRGGGKPTENQGAVEVENGWHIYDLYDPNGENPWNVRTYVIFMGEGYEGFDDRAEGIQIEFDFEALSMPEYTVGHDSRSSGYSNYAINWSISDKAGADKYSNVIMGGIYNTADGLYLNSKGSLREDIKLNKYVGDNFRVALKWHADGTFEVFIDGELFVSYVDMDASMHAIGNCSFVINCLRSADPAVKPEDSIDVYMTNIAFGKAYSEGGLNKLDFETIRGENEAQDVITSDLYLPQTINNGQRSEEMPLTWSSNNPSVIDPATGKVNVPAAGAALVTLTATDRNGNTKTFDLIVSGLVNDNTGKLVVTKDTNPAVGAGNTWDPVLFTLDESNNSLILDSGAAIAFTTVILRDGDAFARLNRESLTLWVSDDNVTYTQIRDYKLLHKGEFWYLYDFTANARYVKVHYTHFDATASDFVGALSTMIAVADGGFGANGGTWNETKVTLTNTTSAKWQDKAVTLPGVTGDSSTRVLLNDRYLYHYMDGENIVVRIPDLEAGASAELTVLTGNADALDISNKEAVYEVTYGTRETTYTNVHRWITSLKAGAPLPGGGTVERDMILSMDHSTIDVSYDGGVTWSKYSTLPQEIRDIAFGYGGWADGGFIYDAVTGRLFYQMMVLKLQFDAGSMENNNSYMVVIYSDDAGKTWTYTDTLEPDVIDGKPMNYSMSYNDGLMLSTYDGSGPNVDFVFTAGAQYDVGGVFCTRVAYSVDGGFTWQYSKNLMISEGAADFEDGLSESSILENEDGVLVLYSRNQVKDAVTFARCYSYDKGITWTSPADPDTTDADVVAEESGVYSGPTEAVMQYWNFTGIGGTAKTPMMIWGGNNAEGGTSYMRSPLSIAVSYDGLDTFRNIQNLYTETFLEAYSDKGKWRTTNPSPAQFGDDMVVTFDSNDLDGDGANNQVQMTVSDFDNWFYRTKGIYDAFEHGTPQSEGWNTVKGSAAQSDAVTENGYAMKLSGVTLITRSVPYFQNGTLSMDLYFAGEAFTLELQPAYCSTMNKVAVISLEVAADGSILCNGKATGLTLQQGWNAVEFELLLTEGEAKLSINGNAADLAVNTRDDYICYITFSTTGTLYVDDVLAESDLDAEIYTGETQKPVELPQITGNLSLNDTVDINFIIPAGIDVEENVLVVKNAATGEDVEYTLLPMTDDTTVVRFSAKSNHMTDEITVQVFDSNGNPLTQQASMSVRKYAQKLFVNCDDTLKMLLIRMLDYGALAQINSGDTTDLANSIVNDELRAFANNYEWDEAVALDIPAGSGGVFQAYLALNETIDVTVSVASSYVGAGDKFVVKRNGVELSEDDYILVEQSNGYLIRCSVNSDEMTDEIYIAIVGEDGAVKKETTLGVRIYAQKFLAAVPTGNQAAMILAMLDYGAMAQIYAKTNTDDLANCFVTDAMRQALIGYAWP